MGNPCSYEVVEAESDADVLVLRDLGPWDEHLTITNDAGGVVRRLHALGLLPPGRRLEYYDSYGVRDCGIKHDGAGKFLGFDFAARKPKP